MTARRCSACGEVGHYSPRCPTVPYYHQRSRSRAAAEQYLQGGTTLREVADQHGITFQAVQQMAARIRAARTREAQRAAVARPTLREELVAKVGEEVADRVLKAMDGDLDR